MRILLFFLFCFSTVVGNHSKKHSILYTINNYSVYYFYFFLFIPFYSSILSLFKHHLHIVPFSYLYIFNNILTEKRIPLSSIPAQKNRFPWQNTLKPVFFFYSVVSIESASSSSATRCSISSKSSASSVSFGSRSKWIAAYNTIPAITI